MEGKPQIKSVVTCDLEGRIETFNKGAEELFGYKPEEVIGKKRVSLFSPGQVVPCAPLEVAAAVAVALSRASDAETPWRFGTRTQRGTDTHPPGQRRHGCGCQCRCLHSGVRVAGPGSGQGPGF